MAPSAVMRASGPSRLPATVWALGAVSFLTDAASEMIVPLLPVFVAGLGGGALALGLVEGVANAVASVLKLVSGRLSDRFGRAHPFVVAGYALSAAARPLVALAAVPWHVVALRAVDRIGKGLRSSPRDAILARSVDSARRGAAFGVQRALDHAGAAVGPLLAVVLLVGFAADVRTVFWAAAVPGAMAVIVVLWFVREPSPDGPGDTHAGAAAGRSPSPDASAPPLWRFLVPYAAVALASVTELFLLMRLGATEAGLPLVGYPLAWLGMHVLKTLAAARAGGWSDRVGRRLVLVWAWTGMAVAYGLLAAFDARPIQWAALALFAVQAGAADGVQRAWVADLVPRARLGTGFGWFHFVEGALALAASAWFGAVWDMVGAAVAFGTAALLAATAVVALVAFGSGRRSPPDGAGQPGVPEDAVDAGQ
ncbi:MAG: MFS transporter [Deltaproteobacteria bacterium]|nr:MAG: MFS transporter [Deltaproteobacteria bacterium]